MFPNSSQAPAEHENLVQEQLHVPSRDTRHHPSITLRTRIIAVLGIDEPNQESNLASPSLGDGWIVSDFYLWLHVLDGMGKSQEWLSSMDPQYLVDKYCLVDKTEIQPIDEGGDVVNGKYKPRHVYKPVQTKWETGFVHGDPFEERVVVLDKNILPATQRKVTIGPKGLTLRAFFLDRLEKCISSAATTGDPVLVMVFSHGDWDQGGLLLGIGDPEEFDPENTLSPANVAGIRTKYPDVQMTMYLTSCFSGHWIETAAFKGSSPTVLAAAQKDQESFGFVWSHSQ